MLAADTPASKPKTSPFAQKPNIVFILADDCMYRSFGCYGGEDVPTPNIDSLADEGLLFARAYASMAMCVPFRHELHTGLHPARNGSMWNHSATRSGIQSTPVFLEKLGYRVGITGKRHLYPESNFPFESVPGFEKNCLARKDSSVPREIIPFLTRDRGQPFCLFINSINAHRPWTTGDPSQFDPQAVKLPVAVGDTSVVREEYVQYLAEIGALDAQVGEVLGILDEFGLAENTLVMFCSEQGWQFPGGKWNNWDLALHTALIARWPGHVAPNTITRALVQVCDILPTLIEVAGGKPPADMDGRSFLPVLLGKADRHRSLAFGMHNNVPEGPPYPIRTVMSEEGYRLVENLTPQADYISRFVNGKKKPAGWYASMLKAAEAGDEHSAFILERQRHRPQFELYAVEADPFEFNNLADDPAQADRKQALIEALHVWMDTQGDPGIAADDPDVLKKNRAAAGLVRDRTGE